MKMNYFNGKHQNSKLIAKHICENVKNIENMTYVDPFCGSLEVTKYMTLMTKKTYANDLCPDLILLWNKVKEGKFKNPNLNLEKWNLLRNSKTPSAKRGFAAFACSVQGHWFSDFISPNKDENNNMVQYRTVASYHKILAKTDFYCLDYISFLQQILNSKTNFVVYMDPPPEFANPTPWKEPRKNFDYDFFWKVCRRLGKMKNVDIFISAIKAPDDFKIVNNFNNKTLDKLYTIN